MCRTEEEERTILRCVEQKRKREPYLNVKHEN